MKSKELLESIVCSIVTKISEVYVDHTIDEMGVLLTLHVAKEDMGKVIGKDGKTAEALRTILRAVGMSENARINMKIAEPVAAPRA